MLSNQKLSWLTWLEINDRNIDAYRTACHTTKDDYNGMKNMYKDYRVLAASAVIAFPAALALARSLAADLLPRSPPPQCLRASSYLSVLSKGNSVLAGNYQVINHRKYTHKLALAADTSVDSSFWSSLLTSWRARTAAVFLWTTVPRRAFDFTITYGTPILRHSAGRKMTSSIGSTSSAITTRLAFLASIRATM